MLDECNASEVWFDPEVDVVVDELGELELAEDELTEQPGAAAGESSP